MTRRQVEVSRRIAANPTDVFNLLVTLPLSLDAPATLQQARGSG